MRTAPFELISIEDLQAAGEMLERLELLDSGEAIESMQRAGEGNMNLVIRVVTPRRSMILKQSRPWVEKYPQIEAPADRILAEIDFYQLRRGSSGDPSLHAKDVGLRSSASRHGVGGPRRGFRL